MNDYASLQVIWVCFDTILAVCWELKTQKFSNNMLVYNFDVFCVCTSWPESEIPDAELYLQKYTMLYIKKEQQKTHVDLVFCGSFCFVGMGTRMLQAATRREKRFLRIVDDLLPQQKIIHQSSCYCFFGSATDL